MFLGDTHEVFRIPERFSKKNTKTKCGYECVYGRKEKGLQMGQKKNKWEIQRKVMIEQFFKLFYKLDFFQNKILGLKQNQRAV